jgi:hypothetical protein
LISQITERTKKDVASRCQSQSPHEAFDALFEDRHIEVDQQALPQSGDSHVRQNLRAVDGHDCVDRLELDYQLVVHDEIGPKSTVESHAVIVQRDDDLFSELKPGLAELVRQARLVDRFE